MSLIGRYEHLPNRPRSDEARPLLEKIASQVKPIMVKRGWKVGTLAEFLPSNPALLGNNWNSGQRINLRLRPPGNETTFYEYDQLVLVMLHELAHNVHGPHDDKFYKLLSELEEEYYSLKGKGYEGEGFHSAGHRLQGIKVNEFEGRRRGLAAAEKRLGMAKAMGKGGVLGGGARNAGKNMREIVAEAAERRMKDDKACDTTSAAEVEAEIRKAQQESVGIDAADIIDLTATDDEDESASDEGIVPIVKKEPDGDGKKRPHAISPTTSMEQPLRARPPPARATKPAAAGGSGVNGAGPTTGPKSASNKPAGSSRSNSTPATASSNPTTPPPPRDDWTCPTCTLINPMSARACDACTTPRPERAVSSQGWYCDFCGAGPRDMGLWTCGECQWVRKWG